jgi:diguanylate cyclase (GGDEF)-like protein
MTRDPSPHAFALREEIDTALARRADFDSWSADLKDAQALHMRKDEFILLRFQLVVGLVISAVTLAWDYVAVPGQFDTALAWRLLTNVPLGIFGLAVLRRGQTEEMKLVVALNLISIGVLSMFLASYGTQEVMARYTMAASFILALSCLALPFAPADLKRYALAYGLITALAGLWPNPLPPQEMGLFIVFSSLVGIPCWVIARRNWNLRARAFLLDMRDDLTRAELEQNNELLRQLSEQDPLTGMPNRRHFERVVIERLEGRKAEQAWPGKLALMMIDLDHFKAFNDRHGHQAGDRCLTLAATQLQSIFPQEYGILARYGGEEFIAAVRERVPGEAMRLAERMRAAIADMLVPVRDDTKPLITTSIGVALAPADTTLDLDDLIEIADVALYTAKRAGRNRVEIIEAGDTAALPMGDDEELRRA